jgi:hypothetical protein
MKCASSRAVLLLAIVAVSSVFVALFVILNTSHVDREVIPAKQALGDVQDKKQSVIKRQQGSGKNGRAQSGLTRSQRAPAIAGSFAKSNYLDHRSQGDVAAEASRTSKKESSIVHATIPQQTVIKPSLPAIATSLPSPGINSTAAQHANHTTIQPVNHTASRPAYHTAPRNATDTATTGSKHFVGKYVLQNISKNLLDSNENDAEDDDHIRERMSRSNAVNLSSSTVSSSSSSKSNPSACKNPSYPPLCDMYDYVRFWRYEFDRPQAS